MKESVPETTKGYTAQQNKADAETDATLQNVTRIKLADKEIILVGTAHISRESVELVKETIEKERPDCVCVELDEKRYKAISQKDRFEQLDIKKIIKSKQLTTLMANLILSSYQKKLGEKIGVLPGSELIEATKKANDLGIPIKLCDRDVRTTLLRAWRKTPILKKGKLLTTLIMSLFDDTEITEEKLRELKKSDVISELMEELGQAMPELKKVLIDERDTYLAEKIKEAEGKKIVAVVGAGHVEGIIRALKEDRSDQLEEISTIPPMSPAWKVAGWAIPALIVGAVVFSAWQKGMMVAGDNITYWILANGIACAIGAIIALCHPATVAAAFAAAPITSLTPVIGAGYVTAFVQAVVRPPVVKEIQEASKDITSVKGWWQNKLLRVFLAFLLPGVGSMVGTWLGGYKIFSSLFSG